MWVEWLNTTIGEQVRLQRGIDITKAEQRAGCVPVVSSGGISSFHDTAYAKAPGVVLGRKGNVGTVFYLTEDYWPHDTSLWVTDFRGNNPRFVYYFFLNLAEELKTMDVGSANPALNRNHIHPRKTIWPQREEQIAIVRVLAALDDKIALNRGANRTLEELATTLFRSLFVDFDAVVAKAAGRDPAHLHPDFAALFPATFEDSSIGPIPRGWEVKTIKEIARYVNGRAFTKDATGTGRMVIRIAELNSGPGASTVYSQVEAGLENLAQPGDLLFAWSGSLDVYRWYRDEAIINQHIFKVICEDYPQWFVHEQLREAMPFFQDIAADKATTMGHIKREHLSQAFLAVPPKDLLDVADKIFQPLYAKQLGNERESLTLAALRDTLLPKLVSGELRVREPL
jgi:type I restriction enzyme S subunit